MVALRWARTILPREAGEAPMAHYRELTVLKRAFKLGLAEPPLVPQTPLHFLS